MNKLILAIVNQFMVEHEDEILECIINPDGDLVKEYLGITEEKEK